jgi:hypothetical protein
MAAPLHAAPPDIINLIPDPETIREQLAESVRRTDLLRSLLRVARRKASYPPTAECERGEGEVGRA